MNSFLLPDGSITADHLKSLTEHHVSESTELEFKRDTYGQKDKDKKELIKDVSAMANTRGGRILIGIEENDGCAAEIVGVQGNADEEIQRLNSIIQSSIEPNIIGFEIQAVSIGDEGHVLVITIPRSWLVPHRTDYKNSKRFYRRNSSGVYEPEVTELRTMFNASLEQERQFSELRQKHIDLVLSGETPIALSSTSPGFLLLQLIPLQSIQQGEIVDLTKPELSTGLIPLRESGCASRYNIDGFMTYSSLNFSYTQLFRNGIVEAVTSSIVSNSKVPNVVPGIAYTRYLLQAAVQYLGTLKALKVQAPIRVYVTFLDVKDCRFATYTDTFGDYLEGRTTFGKDTVKLPPIDIMTYGDKFEIYEAMRPILDSLWNADGQSRCDLFGEDGRWVGDRRLSELGMRQVPK